MNKEVISTRLYFELLSRPDNLTDIEKKAINDYKEYNLLLFKYNDYLIGNTKKELDDYNKNIYLLSMISTEHPDRLNDAQRNELDNYNNKMDVMNENFKKRELIKESENAGFANAFIITGTLIATGIILGASLFFFL